MEGTSHQLAAIMFTDIVGYSALMGQDEDHALIILSRNRKIHQQYIKDFHGTLLKEIGDGNLAHFNSASDAVGCALKIQKEASEKLGARLRIGIHLGEVVLQSGDAFGDGVNIASRIQEITDPGGIYISEAVQKAIRSRANIKVKFLAEVELKNIDYPLKLYALKAAFLPKADLGRISNIRTDKPQDKGFFKSRLNQVVIGLVLAIVVVSLFWLRNDTKDELRVAILPIKNLSQVDQAEYMAAGMHGDMIDELSKIGSLIVTSRTSSSKYAGGNLSVPEIATELNVKLVIESELLEIRDSLRLKIRLIQAEPNEKQLWRKEYHQPTREIMAVYGDMALAISEITSIKVNEEEMNRLSSFKEVDPDAYQSYITGMGHLYDFHTSSIEKALHYFDLALTKDPEYAPAYTGIALAWAVRIQFGYASKKEAKVIIAEALDKAVSLDNSSAVVHYNLALQSAWSFWDWEKGESEFKETIRLAPRHAEARAYYAFFLDFMHRYEESKIQADESIKLQPENITVLTLYAMHLNHNRKFDEAIELLTRILEVDPDYVMALSTLWTVYHNSERFEEAMNTAKLLYSVKKENKVVDILINNFIDYGYAIAMERIAEAFILKSDTSFVTPWQIATLYARSDNEAKSLDWLEQAYKAEDPNLPHINTDPIFDNIRETARFQKLLEQLKLPAN